jgi:dTDP-glucose 4,6-dehydratase
MTYEHYILVTGGCGFIGSNFINYIVLKYPQYFICSIDAMYYSANIENINSDIINASNFKHIEGNVNDYNFIKFIINEYNITDIIHFAAQSHVDGSFDDSLQYTNDNIKGTHTILEIIRKYNNNISFFHFSTDEVYGETDNKEGPKTEMSLLCPTNPYAATKAAAEMLVNAYKHSFKIKTIITRCNNVYGPNQYPEKLIPRFINLLKNNKKCTIHGSGNSLRSFIHVYDVCSAMDIILHKGIIGEIYNIGGDLINEYSVIDIAKILITKIKNTNNYNEYIEYIDDRPYNDKRYFITSDKLKNLDWKPLIDFNNGIDELLKYKD